MDNTTANENLITYENLELIPANRVEILTVVDDFVNFMLPDTRNISRLHRKDNLLLPENPPLADNALSLLITVKNEDISHTVLLNTGFSHLTFINNMNVLDVNISDIETVILSSGHSDHIGGLYTLLENTEEPPWVVAHPDCFLSRHIALPDGRQLGYPTKLENKKLSELGVMPVTNTDPVLIADNSILVTGQIPRNTSFEKCPPEAVILKEEQPVHDQVDDNQAIIINLEGMGLVIIMGRAYAGVINTINLAKELTGESRVYALIGGFNLEGKSREVMDRTMKSLEEMPPEVIIPMHSTGWMANGIILASFPRAFQLNSVGSTITLTGTEWGE